MITWKETVLVPVLESTHIAEGYENTCENCEKWGEACETCNASIPLVTDKYVKKEITYGQAVCCGIPIGSSFRVSE